MPADTSPGEDIKAPAGNRRGFPLVPTLMVLLALPILIGFGVWQLQRAEWKEGLLAQLSRNADLPPVSFDNQFDMEAMLFRRASADLSCEGPATPRAGRNARGQSGYSFLFACRAGVQLLSVNAGWASRPDTPEDLVPPAGRRLGVLAPSDPSKPALLGFYLVEAQPPLVASAPPGPETISNNHLSYAVQWFSFAAILATIYGLWLSRWLATNQPRP